MGNENIREPFVIEPGSKEYPEPIFFSKACRQLGIPSEMQQFHNKDGSIAIRVRLPAMPERTFETVLQRAKLLVEREAQGLPTEQLPSGRWPEALEEFADQIPVIVTEDEDKQSVYLDFGRPVQAIGVSPSMARTLSILMMEVANRIDPDGTAAQNHPELVNVGRIRVPGVEGEQEGTVELPSVLRGLVPPQGAGEGESDGSE